MVPIFEDKARNIVMGESLEIVKLLDSHESYGPINIIRPSSTRTDISNWWESFADIARWLHRPRYMKTLLPEFATRNSRDEFRKNHALPSFSKENWMALTTEERQQYYDAAYCKESQDLMPAAESALNELESLIFSPNYCSEGGFSYDDIDLWPKLRSLTLVRDLAIPPRVNEYLRSLATSCDIPLYFPIQC